MNLMPDEPSKRLEDMGESVEKLRNKATSARRDMIQKIGDKYGSMAQKSKGERWSENPQNLPSEGLSLNFL